MVDEIKGAVFPALSKHLNRLFDDKNINIFIKFGNYRYLANGQKLVFYDLAEKIYFNK